MSSERASPMLASSKTTATTPAVIVRLSEHPSAGERGIYLPKSLIAAWFDSEEGVSRNVVLVTSLSSQNCCLAYTLGTAASTPSKSGGGQTTTRKKTVNGKKGLGPKETDQDHEPSNASDAVVSQLKCTQCDSRLLSEHPASLTADLWEILDLEPKPPTSPAPHRSPCFLRVKPLRTGSLPMVSSVRVILQTLMKQRHEGLRSDLDCWAVFDMLQRPTNHAIIQHSLANTVRLVGCPVDIPLSTLRLRFILDLPTLPAAAAIDTCQTCQRASPRAYCLSPDVHVDIPPPLTLQTPPQSLEAARHDTNDDVNITTRPTGFSTLGGCTSVIRELHEAFIIPMMFPGIFQAFGVTPPRGILLHGPPGTGKSFIAQALATEVQTRWIEIYNSLSNRMAQGDASTEPSVPPAPAVELVCGGTLDRSSNGVATLNGQSSVQELPLMDTHTSTLVIFDEIDALCCHRNHTSATQADKRLLASMLTHLDGIQTSTRRCGMVILATTNRPNDLDPALRRAGRFDREIEIGVPTAEEREDILRKMLESIPHRLDDEHIVALSRECQAFVAADLKGLCSTAALLALNGYLEQQGDTQNACHGVNPDTRGQKKPFSPTVTLQNFMDARQRIRPSGMKEIMLEVPHVRWTDIGGYNHVKETLKESVEWPIKYRDEFLRLNVTPPRGILLYGPPGCSKTLMAKAVATESKMNFIAVKGPELLSKWFGESERAVRDVFRKARLNAPCIIFFDEIDALGVNRQERESGVEARVLSQMLNEMDGIETAKQVIVIGATNRPDLLDSALLRYADALQHIITSCSPDRPGRLDRLVYVPLPDVESRRDILRVHLHRLLWSDTHDTTTPVSLEDVAERTAGLTGAEIAMLCREAAMLALREAIATQEKTSRGTTPLQFEVVWKHLEESLKVVKPRISPASLRFYEDYQHSVARF